MQQDILAFEEQLNSVNDQLKQKETELHRAASEVSKLKADSEARVNQLSTDLQAAQHSIEVLHADAKTAALLHEVSAMQRARMHACRPAGGQSPQA